MALDVYLTNACNLHCKFCFNLDREDAPRIPLESIRHILDAAYERHNRYVSITGGEPFLYKKIFEVLDHAHQLGFWISVLSHGGLVDAATVKRLKTYWRARIRISLDGPDPETHDLHRGAGTFRKAIAAIELLAEGGINVGVGMTVSESNVGRVGDVLALCLDKRVAFVRCVPVARVKKGTTAHVTAALHEQLLETLIGFALRHSDVVDLPGPGLSQAAIPASIDVLTTRRCMAGKHFFGITPDQKILPCSLLAEHRAIPSVRFEGARSFDVLGDDMDAVFSGMQDHLSGICATCEFREVCCTGCLAEKISFERDLSAEQPVCTKLILERIRGRVDPAGFDRLVRSWVWQVQNSLESCDSHACMRQAPYWSLNFKTHNRWNDTALRFN